MDRIIELEQAQAAMLVELKRLQNAPVGATDAKELFASAKSHFDQKEYDKAIGVFTQYLALKKAPQAEEATFLRGEAYYALKDYKKAIADYSKFQEKYTTSPKNGVALYKIGLSFEALGMKEEAKTFYQELIDKFPKSAEAKAARKRAK